MLLWFHGLTIEEAAMQIHFIVQEEEAITKVLQTSSVIYEQ